MNLPFGIVVGPEAGLGGQKKSVWIFSQPRGNAQLGIPIAGCEVEMVNAISQQDLEGLVRFILGHL